MWKATGRIGLVVVLVAGILAANAYACRIIDPRPRPRPWPRPRPAPPKPQAILTRYHSAEIDVKDQVATVTVNATFYNPNPFRMEGTYWFPLPAEASVKQFRMEINGKKVEGELLSADRAKKIYEDIVRKQKDPGLLEWVGSQMLKCRVYPMEPRKETKVELSYTHMLRKDAGLIRLDYPLRSAKPNAGVVDQLVVKVDIETTKPLKTLYCPTHDVDVKRDGDHKARLSFEGKSIDPKRDVQVVFSRSADDIDLSVLSHDPRAEDGYFLMMVTPKVEIDKDKVIQKDIVFVFDTSGSMNADNKIEQAKKALAFCVSSLNDGDRFGIVAFSGGIRYFRKDLVEKSDETVAAAREYIGDLKAVGGTAINDA
ncbi:MAG: VIT and VWA domain-containing protein, partial [Planctomycetota bacterium]